MSLIGEERKDYILNQLNLEGKVKTNELVESLGVSSESIRRYLEELEEENKLKRVYGGAVKINLSREEPSQLKREVLYAEEKRKIGRAAATLVEDNEVIFIDDQLAKKMMEQSKHNIVVTDHSKFGLVQFYKIADLKDVDIIVSDVPAPKEWEEYLLKKDVAWVAVT
ncbi:DeoR/GlpR family DNA-binding transcription regulator [Paenibacillus sp. LjRoot56]|uniref:DeoR/GlpR family DNA-binding transcription regulator n=1 Tax=Paenibacillus sp. LjRoot56 TaxID=3342333 RepID=UPI003ECF6170